ncbi:hypothetical protein Pcinc_031134 [Petrolisthes cinctipes]|uniref:GAF domain-containing protein n=1 Tax=Petrolisthes cinctipes TaxID=88211 RepID=A0AAE1EWZ5_PETCI|nr:hypothetical protein Pcinc_031134 [Petrolisthes cinctipes]
MCIGKVVYCQDDVQSQSPRSGSPTFPSDLTPPSDRGSNLDLTEVQVQSYLDRHPHVVERWLREHSPLAAFRKVRGRGGGETPTSATPTDSNTHLVANYSYASRRNSLTSWLSPKTGKTRKVERLTEPELFMELIRDISTELDIDTLCHKILVNVGHLTHADRASLFLAQGPPSARCLVAKLFDVTVDTVLEEALSNAAEREILLPWGVGIVGHVADTKEVINIKDAYQVSTARVIRGHHRSKFAQGVIRGHCGFWRLSEVKVDSGVIRGQGGFKGYQRSRWTQGVIRGQGGFRGSSEVIVGSNVIRGHCGYRGSSEVKVGSKVIRGHGGYRGYQRSLWVQRLSEVIGDTGGHQRSRWVQGVHQRSLWVQEVIRGHCGFRRSSEVIVCSEVIRGHCGYRGYQRSLSVQRLSEVIVGSEVIRGHCGLRGYQRSLWVQRLSEVIVGTGGHQRSRWVQRLSEVNDPRFDSSVDRRTGYRTMSVLCMPVCNYEGEVIGVAEIINKKNGTSEFTKQDVEVFQRYLTFCGIGIQNAQLFDMSVREYKRNQLLLHLARGIFEEQTSLDRLVTKIMTEARELLKCERCSVYLLNQEATQEEEKAEKRRRGSSDQTPETLVIRQPQTMTVHMTFELRSRDGECKVSRPSSNQLAASIHARLANFVASSGQV